MSSSSDGKTSIDKPIKLVSIDCEEQDKSGRRIFGISLEIEEIERSRDRESGGNKEKFRHRAKTIGQKRKLAISCCTSPNRRASEIVGKSCEFEFVNRPNETKTG